MKYKITAVLSATAILLTGCGAAQQTDKVADIAGSSLATATQTSQAIIETASTAQSYDYAKKALDASYDASAKTINLSEQNGKVSITSAGEYIITGALSDGYIEIDTDDDVQLVLNGASITNTNGAAIVGINGDVIITLADGTENNVTASSLSEDANGAIYSSDDLYFNGTGALSVTSDEDAVVGKDDVAFISGTYVITAGDDGIRGKDALAIKDGTYTITAEGDALKSTNDTEAELGSIYIDGGKFDITAAGDGAQAENTVYVTNGDINIVSGGGSTNAAAKTQNDMGGKFGGDRMYGGFGGTAPSDEGAIQPPDAGTTPPTDGTTPPQMNRQRPDAVASATQNSDTAQAQTNTLAVTAMVATTEQTTADTTTDETATDSFKGIKAGVAINILNGNITIDSADDSIHTNGVCTISGGTMTLTSGDDGVHADDTLNISGRSITVVNSYEGLEAAEINITGGENNVTATDDGINAAGGTDTANGQMDSFSRSTGTLNISGGTNTINAAGDGLDANGAMTISGGLTIVYGPENSGNGALDYDGSCTITDGTLIALGASGMAQMPSECTQPALMVTFSQTYQAGTVLTLKNANGDEICTATAAKSFSNAVISTPDMQTGESYTLYADGTEVVTTTLDNASTSISDTGAAVSGGMGGMQGGMGGRGNKMQ